MASILTDEEILIMINNGDLLLSDEDFGLNSGSDSLGEGDSADDDCDQNNIVEQNIANQSPASLTETDLASPQISRENNYNWSTFRPQVIDIPFSETPGLKIFPKGNDPIDYFNLFVTNTFWEFLVEEANSYAVEVFLNSDRSNSRISTWKNTDVVEMKKCIALLFHTGTIRVNRLEDYWKTNELFNFHIFRSTMSRNRFMLLLRVLHFCKNPGQNDNPTSRLHKIDKMTNYFNKTMEELYQPSKNLSIDESMVLFRGRLMFRQYIKNKRHKYGIKLYMMTESWGLVHRVLIYSGEGTGTSEELSHTEYVVEKLMEGYYYKGHSIYMDNYYNSVKLAHYLLEKQTYCTGTLRANRKNNPKAINDKKLKKGETICQYTEKGVGVVKWKDRRDVIAISSEHSHDLVNITNRRGIIKSKPLSIIKYNEYMSGIDRQDQMLSYYPCERKTFRWYKKLGIHFIKILLLNSYLLYNKNVKKISFYDYRLKIISTILNSGENNITKRQPTNNNALHFSKKVPKNKNNKIMYKRCKLCSSKGVRKMMSFYCSMCEDEPGFCLDCFEEFHRSI